jgi:hypothetical protein
LAGSTLSSVMQIRMGIRAMLFYGYKRLQPVNERARRIVAMGPF